uniref:Uncharacterized protein n=1 Tax=Zea mays TaxID=4577 RepID=A0A804QIR0_MAIZE
MTSWIGTGSRASEIARLLGSKRCADLKRRDLQQKQTWSYNEILKGCKIAVILLFIMSSCEIFYHGARQSWLG